MPLLTTGVGGYPAVGGGGGGSVWGDHGTNITLSTTTIANDTATGAANSFSSVRGTQAHSSPGKYYFEVKFLTAPAIPNFIVGMMDDTTANGAPMDDRLLVNSAGHGMFNGNQQSNGSWNGSDLGAGWSLADNDVMAVAADFTNNFYYLALNNVWFLSGDPTSGALGTGSVGAGGRVGARPMLSLFGVGAANSGLIQLETTSFTFTPPAGYSAWG